MFKRFYQIFSSLNQSDYELAIDYLRKSISNLFVEEYYHNFPNSEIVEFDVNGYTYLFDLDVTDSANEDRVVGVYGRSIVSSAIRDKSRIQGFVGQFSKIEKYKGYDKGHFIAHKLCGSLDQNLYPQLMELNRGISKQGKLFRFIEKYCEQNPDVFLFTRPIYADSSWLPSHIDYGVYTKEFGLLLNRFDNYKNK